MKHRRMRVMSLVAAVAMSVSILTAGGCASAGKEETPATEGEKPTAEGEAAAPAAEEGEPIVLKFSLIEVEDSAQSQGAQLFKKTIEELSDGQITVQLYYNSTLYTQEGGFAAIRSGELEMTNISIQQISEIIPPMAMFASSYIFKDYDHMRAVIDSDIGNVISARAEEEVGIVPLAYFYNGARQLNLKWDKDITKPEDLSSVVLRMPGSAAWIAAGEALGAKVSPLDRSEVYTALQTGTVNAQDNPLSGTYDSKYYEVTDQLCLTHHIIDVIPICVSKVTWDKMTDQQKQWMYEAAAQSVELTDSIQLEREKELTEFFKGEGLRIIEPDIDAFMEYARKYYEENGLMDDWDMDIYAKIQELK